MRQTKRLLYFARQPQPLLNSRQCLIGFPQQPKGPGRETWHRYAGMKRVSIIDMLGRVVQCKSFVVVFDGQFELSQMGEGGLQSPMAAHRQSRIGEPLCKPQ